MANEADAWATSIAHAISSRSERRIGRRFAAWNIVPIDPTLPGIADNVVLVASGQPAPFDFGPLEIEDFAYWLDDAEWLDPFPFLAAFSQSERNDVLRLLEIVGDPGELPRFTQSVPRQSGLLRFTPLLVALTILRYTWRIAQEIQKGSIASAAAIYASRPRRPDAEPSDLSNPQLALDEMRAWMVGNLVVFGFEPSINPEVDPLRHFTVGSRPSSPMQLVLLAIAIGAGAASAPVPALQVCNYAPCGRTFVAVRSGVRGANVFCSPRCGKRFHSTKNTYAKRAAKRAEKQNPKEQ